MDMISTFTNSGHCTTYTNTKSLEFKHKMSWLKFAFVKNLNFERVFLNCRCRMRFPKTDIKILFQVLQKEDVNADESKLCSDEPIEDLVTASAVEQLLLHQAALLTSINHIVSLVQFRKSTSAMRKIRKDWKEDGVIEWGVSMGSKGKVLGESRKSEVMRRERESESEREKGKWGKVMMDEMGRNKEKKYLKEIVLKKRVERFG